MGFKKTQKVEKVQIGPPKLRVAIKNKLSKLGKKSVKDLEEEDKTEILESFDN